jgi:biopolymer transport protein ExbB/TolQ
MEPKEVAMLNIDRIAIYGIGGLVLIVLAIFGYYSWKHAVSQAALAEWNKKQLEIVVRDQQDFIRKLEETHKLEKLIAQQLAKSNKDLEAQLHDLEDSFDKPEVKKEYEGKISSQVLRDTMKRLEEMRKADEK